MILQHLLMEHGSSSGGQPVAAGGMFRPEGRSFRVGISTVMRSALGERIRVFSAKEKSGQWGIKPRKLLSPSCGRVGVQRTCVCVCVCVCGLSVLMFHVCMGGCVWMHACLSPPCTACAQSYLSQEWQPPVGKKEAVNVGEVREAATASRGKEGWICDGLELL